METAPDVTAAARFRVIAEIPGSPRTMRIYEHGWQSWSPAGLYPGDLPVSPRPHRSRWQTMAFRPDRPAPERGFGSEGLLAIVDPDGGAHAWVAPDPTRAVPSLRVEARDDRLVVLADGDVERRPAARSLEAALADVAACLAPGGPSAVAQAGIGPGWCSWYGHGAAVTEADIDAALAALDDLALPIDLVQVDDGYQAAIGDWLEPGPGFGPIGRVARRILDRGRRPGLWTAPFCVSAASRLAQEHPDWLVGDALAAEDHWGGPVRVLDVTHPDAAHHLGATFRTLAEAGIAFHKLDFLYAGAMPGRRHADVDPLDAYRLGLRLIRDAIGPDATILGCGAPLLPSIGLVDAMRVSPDVDPAWEPALGDVSQPGMRSALLAGRARGWMHGRLWVNDPDCLIVRPDVAGREAWADHVAATGGLVLAGDPLGALDATGLALLRATLRPSTLATPRWDPDAGPDGGLLRPGAG